MSFSFQSTFIFLTQLLAVIGLMIAPTGAFAKTRECYALFVPFGSGLEASILSDGFRPGTAQVDGRTTYFEHLPAAEGKGTALIFIGVYTPIAVDFVQFKKEFAARSKGEGLVIMSYDSMPDSLSMAAVNGTGKRPFGTRANLGEMVRDATAIVNVVSPQGPVAVVGYSYGSAPAVEFAKFHRDRVSDLIFVAPLVFNGETTPNSQAGFSAMSTFAMLNPMFGSLMLERTRERIASSTGERWTASYFDSSEQPVSIDRRDVVEGIAGRIRATEDFDLRRQNFDLLPQTHFVLPEKEHPLRLLFQKEVVSEAVAAARENPDRIPTLTNVPEGGHVVLNTNPVESVDAVLSVLRNRAARPSAATSQPR